VQQRWNVEQGMNRIAGERMIELKAELLARRNSRTGASQ